MTLCSRVGKGNLFGKEIGWLGRDRRASACESPSKSDENSPNLRKHKLFVCGTKSLLAFVFERPHLPVTGIATQRKSDMTSTRSLVLKNLIVGAVIAICAPLFIFGATSALTVDVVLDTDFGTEGIVTTDFGSGSVEANVATLQPDGKVLLAGTSNGDFAVARYNSNGTLDSFFGTNGKVTTSVGPIFDSTYALALQPDGKILAGGFSQGTSSADFAVVRYNSNGTLDTAFGTGGIVTTSVGPDFELVRALALQPDGKILAAGIRYASTNFNSGDFAVVRYNSDGTLDTAFGTGGIVTTDFFGKTDEISAITLQSDGKILAAGAATRSDSSISDFAVVRYNINGTLDTGFGTGGKVTTVFGTGSGFARSVALAADGKILLAGGAIFDGRFRFAVVRYDSNGTLDTTFGADGTGAVSTKINTGDTDHLGFSMAIQSDGKIILGGSSTSIDGDFGSAVVRYNSNGTLDNTFGTDGIVTTDFFGKGDSVIAVISQSDGKILLAGTSQNFFAAARYNVTVNVPAIETPNTPGEPTPNTPSEPTPNTPSEPTPVLIDGAAPVLAPGQVAVYEDGVAVEVQLSVADEIELVLSAPTFELRLSGECESGCTVRETSTGGLVLTLSESGAVAVEGTGFLPGSVVDLWMFSEPRYLGQLTVGADGKFAGVSQLGDIAVGEHTVQVNGLSAAGSQRSANLGVEVNALVAATPTAQPDTLPAVGLAGELWSWMLVALALGGFLLLSARRPQRI
jgi:uncharacterized delta-60 repeat protein